MINSKQLEMIQKFAQSFHQNDTTGHDWWHINRVTKLSKKIAVSENADISIVETIALLHDTADYKLNNGNEVYGFFKIEKFLTSIEISDLEIQSIIKDIKNISFKGGNNNVIDQTIESKIVQDADRIDALGAIGIARTFAYGGSTNRTIYNPDVLPKFNQSIDEYKNSTAPTINHFYEKLLLLKDLMNTETAKKIAQERHAFLEQFLGQFFTEWNGDS